MQAEVKVSLWTAASTTLSTRPILASVLIVGAVLSPLLVGVEPIGSDVDLMYRPIKEVLAKGLRAGTIPYWTDDFGLGMPLVAESHMAAFYPPNWFFYRVFPVSLGYRLSMWLHFVALSALTHSYAGRLGFSPAGRVAAAVGFSLCGFQAIHAVHEPFYTLMPYLPLCLLLGDGYAATGHRGWLAGLALAWGIQLTIGHFQIQMWTAGLVLWTGLWRIRTGRLPWSRALGLGGALAWGACIALIQLWLTWELTRVSGFERGALFLSIYRFPTTHWAQWALPAVYLGRSTTPNDAYWTSLMTTPNEASAYVGVTLLVMACVGLVAPRSGDRRPGPWPWIAALGFVLATLPGWWPDGFALVVKLPGLGWFRAPARYTLLTSLGLVLLAGRGLDRSIPRRSFGIGLGLALALGVAAWAWSLWLAGGTAYQSSFGPDSLAWRFAASLAAWGFGLGAIIAWRMGRIGSWGPLAVMTLELAGLFYANVIPWGMSVVLPDSSPILQRLLAEPRSSLIAGRLQSLPARVGLSPAYPAMGITPPPPNYLLETTRFPTARSGPNLADIRWQRRLGVSHGIWADSDEVNIPGAEVVAELPDPAFDRLLWDTPGLKRPDRWKLVRYPEPFPPVRIALRACEVDGWGAIHATLSNHDLADIAWFEYGQGPPEAKAGRGRPWSDLYDSSGAPRPADVIYGIPARVARLREWEGLSGRIEHDGTCYLILRRTYYPGWTYRIDGGLARPVLKVDGGLQCVPLPILQDGAGLRTSHVELSYQPTGQRLASAISLFATAAALGTIGLSLLRRKVV